MRYVDPLGKALARSQVLNPIGLPSMFDTLPELLAKRMMSGSHSGDTSALPTMLLTKVEWAMLWGTRNHDHRGLDRNTDGAGSSKDSSPEALSKETMQLLGGS